MKSSKSSRFVKLAPGDIMMCKLFGHKWLINKQKNRWQCARCAGELLTHQLDTYGLRPYPKQARLNTYGDYYWDSRKPKEVTYEK